MTEKLYYEDAYISEFCAKITSVTECDRCFDLTLDKTAFFPEEGGQASDGGTIDGKKIVYVYEENGVIHHIVEEAPSHDTVFCALSFRERFDKMQQHTAEHILCGIIHNRFGFENVGFHLASDEVVFDINGVLTQGQVEEIEEEANRVVCSNVRVEAFFPNKEELPKLSYRSKLDLTENVRIVKIGEIDSCACCAPHVAYTGEIGLIKILDCEKHRGGLRIWMAAGERALRDYQTKLKNVEMISAMLSEPQRSVAEGVRRLLDDYTETKNALKRARIELVRQRALQVDEKEGGLVHYLKDNTIDEMREFANILKDRFDGVVVVIGGEELDYKYLLASNTVDLTREIKKINLSLSGRGGGKSNMVQGTFRSSLKEIQEYFENNKTSVPD